MLGIFLDIEANGLNPYKHRSIEIAYKIIDLYSKEEKETFNYVISQPEEVWQQSDLESLKVNGFTFEEVSKGKSEKNIADLIISSFNKYEIKRKKAVFICQNPSFDRIYFSQIISPDIQESLLWPYHWLDLASMYWATAMKKALLKKDVFPWETGLSKDFIASHLGLDPEKKPHRALNGVNHLIKCYEAIVGFPYMKI